MVVGVADWAAPWWLPCDAQWALSECYLCVCVCGVIEKLSTNYGSIMDTQHAQQICHFPSPLKVPPQCRPLKVRDAPKLCTLSTVAIWRRGATRRPPTAFDTSIGLPVALKKKPKQRRQQQAAAEEARRGKKRRREAAKTAKIETQQRNCKRTSRRRK